MSGKMKNYLIKIYGVEKKVIKSTSIQSAISYAAHIWMKGDQRGISAVEIK